MNLRLQSSSAALPSAAFLGSCSLHVLALLLIAGWLASSPPVTLPKLASLPAMTLAAPSAPPAAAAATPPSQHKQHTPAKPAVARPAVAPTPKPAAKPVARTTAAAAKPAAVTEAATNVSATPAAPVAATPAPTPAPVVHEPLYRGGYLNNPQPSYPPLSLEMEETGTVRVRVQVSAQGLPVSVELEHSSGFPRLDRAALTAVRGWKFIPAKRGDEAIPYTFIVPVEFSLKNPHKP